MRIRCPRDPEYLTPQKCYNRLRKRIYEIESDVYSIETILRMCGNLRKFFEDHYQVK